MLMCLVTLVLIPVAVYADWVPDVPPPTPVESPYNDPSSSDTVKCTIKKVPVQVPCGGTRQVCHKDPWGTEICVDKENTCTEYVDVEDCR